MFKYIYIYIDLYHMKPNEILDLKILKWCYPPQLHPLGHWIIWVKPMVPRGSWDDFTVATPRPVLEKKAGLAVDIVFFLASINGVSYGLI